MDEGDLGDPALARGRDLDQVELILLDEEADGLAEIEEQIGKSIRLQPESLYLKDQFDVVLI